MINGSGYKIWSCMITTASNRWKSMVSSHRFSIYLNVLLFENNILDLAKKSGLYLNGYRISAYLISNTRFKNASLNGASYYCAVLCCITIMLQHTLSLFHIVPALAFGAFSIIIFVLICFIWHMLHQRSFEPNQNKIFRILSH